MRHADAIDGNGNDFSRTLSESGRSQAEKMGRWLKDMKLGKVLVVTSPLPRAHETANIVASCLGDDETLRPDERLSPGMTTEEGTTLVHEFGQSAERLLLVGHAPDLGALASYLMGAKEQSVEMRKGAIACFDTTRAGFGGSVLKWLITPKL